GRRQEAVGRMQLLLTAYCLLLTADYGPLLGVIVLTTSLTRTCSPAFSPLVISTDSLLLRPIVTGRLSLAGVWVVRSTGPSLGISTKLWPFSDCTARRGTSTTPSLCWVTIWAAAVMPGRTAGSAFVILTTTL